MQDPWLDAKLIHVGRRTHKWALHIEHAGKARHIPRMAAITLLLYVIDWATIALDRIVPKYDEF